MLEKQNRLTNLFLSLCLHIFIGIFFFKKWHNLSNVIRRILVIHTYMYIYKYLMHIVYTYLYMDIIKKVGGHN